MVITDLLIVEVEVQVVPQCPLNPLGGGRGGAVGFLVEVQVVLQGPLNPPGGGVILYGDWLISHQHYTHTYTQAEIYHPRDRRTLGISWTAE